MNCEDVPDEDRPMANLCGREENWEETTISTRDGPCAIEDVECRRADSNVSQDLRGQDKRSTVYFVCQVVECGAT